MLRSSHNHIQIPSQSNLDKSDMDEQNQQKVYYHPDQLEAKLERIGDNLQNVYKIDKKKQLKYIDVGGLDGGKLASDETFHYLRQELMKWKEQQLTKTANQITFVEFKNKLYEELTFQLNEIVQTKQKYNQQKFLQDVKFWYNQQISMMKSQSDPQKAKPILFNKSQVQQYNQDQAYKEQNRTKYNNIEPAEDRVKQYDRKIPQNYMDSMQESNYSKPTTAQGSTSQNWFTNSLLQNRKEQNLNSMGQDMNISYRPGSTTSNFRFKSDNVNLNENQHQFIRNNMQSAESQIRPDTGFLSMKSNQSAWGNQMNFGNFKTVVINDKISEKNENSKIPKIEEERYAEFHISNGAGLEYEDKQSIQKAQEVKSAYKDYVSTQSIPELRMEQKWLHNRHKELLQKREDEEFVKFIQTWSKNKAQYEEEMIKKHQYYLHGSKFFNMQIQKKHKEKKEECSDDDFQEVFADKEEENDELEFQNYLSLKNGKNSEKQKNKVFQSQRVQTFLEQQRESLTDLKDDKNQRVPSMLSVDEFGNNNNKQRDFRKSFEAIDDKGDEEEEEKQEEIGGQKQKQMQQNQLQQAQEEEEERVRLEAEKNKKKNVFGNFRNVGGVKADKFSRKSDQIMHNNLIIPVENRAAIQKAQQMRLVQTANDVSKRDHRNIGDLELEMKRERIEKIRKMRGKIIGQQQAKVIDEEPIVIQKRKDLSLSVYNRKNNPFKEYAQSNKNNLHRNQSNTQQLSKTKSTFNFGPTSQVSDNFSKSAYQFYKNKQKNIKSQVDYEWKSNQFCTNGRYRPFSSIYGSISTTDIKKQQIHDFRKSKNAMAKSGIKINAKTLSQALLTPEAMQVEELTILPRADSMLFSNPFMVTKKKKNAKKV